MNLIENLIEKLQRHPKRFVFPDGEDSRVLQAARQIVSRGMGVPMIVGNRSVIKEKAAKFSLSTKGMRIIEPDRSSEVDQFVEDILALPRFEGISSDEAKAIVTNRQMFATLMLNRNQAEALVSGATANAPSALRPLFQIIGTQDNVKSASSLMVLDLEEKPIGIDGTLFMGDCGVIPNPDSDQLADIAITTAILANHLTNQRPLIAMLSYATHGDPTKPQIGKIQEATAKARALAEQIGLEVDIEGDIQVDAALDMATAHTKGIESSPVAGRANILVFPDLNSGNIASKLVQVLTGANTYGQILMGLKKPAAEISRGATAHDILGAAAIAGCQAIDRSLLYGH